MAKGRSGFYLEGWKFAVYLALPLGASWYYNDPSRQKASADYWKFVEYPANANNLQEQVEELRKQQKSRQAYKDQLLALEKQAARPKQSATDLVEQEGVSWWRRLLRRD